MTVESHVVQMTVARPLLVGRPTMEELRLYYPARFTWPQLKAFINSGDLGLLKRDKNLQYRYDCWAVDIKKEYGSTISYLVNHRLQWGKPDTLSLLTSSLDISSFGATQGMKLEDYPTPKYFKADIPINSELICIIRNDWPYSVPPEIEHSLIWSRVPIFHTALISPDIEARVEQDGLFGITGSTDPLSNLPTLESCLPALADWGITIDMLVCSPKPSEVEEAMLKSAGKEVHEFVKRRWKEDEWETAWFVNPPRLQSVRDLAHVHVFARRKTAEEEASWRC